MFESILKIVFRALVTPYRFALNQKLRGLVRNAQRAIAEGASGTPEMLVVGSPPIRLTKVASPVQAMDFTQHRSPAYVEPMTTEVADNLAAVLSGSGRAVPMSVEALVHGLFHTPTAYLAERVGDRWVIDLRGVTVLPHLPISVVSCSVGDDKTLEITGADGRVHRLGDDTYDAAVCHLVQWWGIYVTSGLHNWVHFSLPDTMAEAHTKLSRPDSVLARFLAPHVRFTSRINCAGLWENKATHNPPNASVIKHIYAGVPFIGEAFQQGVIENTGHHYADCAAHFAQPESFDERVPYLAALKAYFPPFQAFVSAIDPHIDDADWEELLVSLEATFPDIRAIPRIRVLAAFAWQVGVIHGTDHIAITDYITDHAAFAPPASIEPGFTAADLPWSVRWKTMNMLAVFVRYNRSSVVNNHLIHIENYKFEGDLLQAAEQFRDELCTVAQELDARGILVRGPEDLPQSVCF